jgi:hypothetical protein
MGSNARVLLPARPHSRTDRAPRGTPHRHPAARRVGRGDHHGRDLRCRLGEELLIDVWHVPIWLSLAVIAGVLTVTVLLSLRTTPRSRTAA